ncbi:hypothetical protein [Microviridae sp.]|nr:hypothetical protein [Microviridae sp.]
MVLRSTSFRRFQCVSSMTLRLPIFVRCPMRALLLCRALILRARIPTSTSSRLLLRSVSRLSRSVRLLTLLRLVRLRCRLRPLRSSFVVVVWSTYTALSYMCSMTPSGASRGVQVARSRPC